MMKLTSVALSAALGVAAVAASLPAAACPVVEVVRPVGYVPVHYRPYYAHARYWHPEVVRFDRFHHRWDGR
jgi:hypothetical protein